MSKVRIIIFILIVSALAVAQMPVAELPRTYINTTWNLPAGGTTWAAHTSAQLSSAIKSASPGDIIVLDAGATYVGGFQLPAKANSNNKWIYVVSSAIAKLPAGRRVSPSAAANMPKIVTPNVAAAFQVNGGANHWRFAGLEITPASNYPAGCPANGQHCMTYFLIGSQSNPTPLPDSFVVDRCYVHGSPTQDLQQGIQMTASNYAVIDSYVDDIHIKGFDSSGIGVNTSPGPFKIVNNYVSASTENIIFGGSGQGWGGYVPSDIEIRHNYLFKPLAWVPLSLAGSMVVKNAFELKSAQRVLFDGNTIENVWYNGQLGFAIVLTVRSSQSGDVAVVNDVTITNNVLKNVVSGFNTLAKDDTCGAAGGYPNCHNAGSQDRWYIADNLILFYDPTLPGGVRNLALALNSGLDRINNNTPGVLRDVVFRHNTTISAASTPCWESIYFSVASTLKPPFTNLTSNIWLLDNALCRQPTGDWGLQGSAGLTQYMGSPAPFDKRFVGNAMYVPKGDKVQSFPVHNYASTVPFTYVSVAGNDYQLATPYWTDTSDGKLSGIDYSALSGASGAPAPLPGTTVVAGNTAGVDRTASSTAVLTLIPASGTTTH